MGDFFGNLGSSLSGWWNDITGKTGRDEKAKAQETQGTVTDEAGKTYKQGAGMVGNASDYWNNWMKNPGQAYQSTLGQAANAGGAIAGQATNNAVNAARGSGLNAGQAALAGGAQSANAFTTGTLGAQGQMMNQGQQAAAGSANAGTALQGQGLGAATDIAGQQQGQSQYDTTRGDKAVAGFTKPLSDAADTLAGGAAKAAGTALGFGG